MQVQDNGSLTLHVYDLDEKCRDQVNPDPWMFRQEAQIAAAYANSAGYKVTFCNHGHPPIVCNNIGGYYLKPRKLKKDGWPRAIPRKPMR